MPLKTSALIIENQLLLPIYLSGKDYTAISKRLFKGEKHSSEYNQRNGHSYKIIQRSNYAMLRKSAKNPRTTSQT